MSTILDQRLVAFAQAVGADLAELAISGGAVTPQKHGATANNSAVDGTAFTAALSELVSAKITGFGYGDGTSRLYVPKGSSLYYMGTTPVDLDATTRIEGEGVGDAGGWSSAQRWGANSHGYRIQYYGTSGNTTAGGTNPGGTGSILSGLALDGAYNGTSVLEGEYHGIFARARLAGRDLNIWNWQGDGIHIHADLGQPESGNASNWQVGPAWFQNVRTALAVSGADANQGIGYAIKISGARWWGISDTAGIQNLYIAPLTQLCGYSSNDGTAGKPVSVVTNVAGTHRYAVKVGRETAASTASPPATAIDDTNWLYYQDGGTDAYHPVWFSGISLRAGGPMYMAGGTILHGYTESVQPPCQFGGAVLRIGGTWGNRVVGGAFIFANSNQVVVNDFRVTTGNITLDDDGNGVFKLPRLSAANPYSYLECSTASAGMLINAPDNSTAIEITNALVQSDKDLNVVAGKVYKVSGTQVLGARQTGCPAAATDLASAITLVNFLRTAGFASGYIGS